MALGAITQVSPLNPTGGAGAIPFNGARLRVINVVLDSSYPTGGSTLTPQQLGLTHAGLWSWEQLIAVGANGPVNVNYNPVTSKLQCFTATGEVAAATNLSTSTVQICLVGY